MRPWTLTLVLAALPVHAQTVRTAAVRAPALPGGGNAAAAPGAGLAELPRDLFRSPAGAANGVLPAPAAPALRSLSAQVVAKVLAEDPGASASLVSSLEAAPFRPDLGDIADPQAWLAERLGEAFVPYFETYAAEVGHADAEAGMRFLLGTDPSAVETRRGLGRVLRAGSARSESWTYLYRDAKLWQKRLEEYLDGRIAEKRGGSRDLHIQSVGAAYGAEPYTLAMLTEDALKRAGEDPKAWSVRIDAADLSLMSLISAREGYYRDPQGNGRYFIPPSTDAALKREREAGRLLPTRAPGLYRLRPDLREWVRPLYLDLNDPRQHRALTARTPDVVFANYVLTHLRLGPAVRLAEHWLSGLWSDHGFLGMAQTLVAEVSKGGGLTAKGKLGGEGSFLRRVSLTVGAIGAAYAGESSEPWARLRDFLFANRSGAARAARRATAAYRESIRKDPFHAEALEPAALAALERLAAAHGVRAELTTSDSIAVGMTRDGAVAVGVGMLLPSAGSLERRLALLERLFPAYAAKAEKSPRGPPAAFSDPRFGEGTVSIFGTAVEGARLKAAVFPDGPRLLWLVPGRLAPISDAYVDEQPPAPPRPPSSGGGITVRF
ncbi:MAG: hypothetical protein HY928_09120 [Elusimicrobia bacterium]|nr:hypothetical protein [Elusimicrobiota bacterium]